MAELIGGHRVFGHSMLWASVLTLITPMSAFIHFKAVVIVRALLGFMLGMCIIHLIHFPKKEKKKKNQESIHSLDTRRLFHIIYCLLINLMTRFICIIFSYR